MEPAVAYLRKSALDDGQLARFYELKTNRPIYFTRDRTGRHVPTYRRERLATNYGFVVESRLDAIEAEYERVKAGRPAAGETVSADEVRKLIAALDDRGAWVERGRLRHHKLEPASGIHSSQTFADRVRVLSGFLQTK